MIGLEMMVIVWGLKSVWVMKMMMNWVYEIDLDDNELGMMMNWV